MKVVNFVCLAISLFILPKQLHSQSCISWQQIIGGAEDERGMDIVFDEATNTYWACGYVTAAADSSNALSKNGWVGNFTKEGILLNEFELKDTIDIIAKSIDISEDALYIATTVLVNDNIPPQYRLYALNQEGEILWIIDNKEYGEINDILIHQGEKIVITGYVEDSLTFDEDVFIKQYFKNGTLLSSRIFGGTNKERANNLVLKGSEFIITGYTLSDDGDITTNYGSRDVWLLAVDLGLFLNPRQKSFGSSSAEGAVGLTIDANNEIVVLAEILNSGGDISTSYGNGDYWAFKLDEDWNIVWEKTFGGGSSDNPKTIAAFSNGDVLLGGITISFDNDIEESFGFFDTWLARLNGETGNLMWSQSIGGNDLDFTAQINITTNDEIVAIGNTDSNSIGCKNDCDTPHEFQNIWVYSLDEEVILDAPVYNVAPPNVVKVFCVNGWLSLSNTSYKIKHYKIYDISGVEYGGFLLMG